MTVPNIITILRIIAVPIFTICMINGDTLAALIVFVIASASDAMDGFIARVFHQKSSLGAHLDPLADKIVLVAAFITLSAIDLLPAWLTVMVISRDVIILLGVFMLVMNKQDLSFSPSLLSKFTTCFQFFTIIVALSRGELTFMPMIDFYIYGLTALLTISSGLHYMHWWFRVMGEGIEVKPG